MLDRKFVEVIINTLQGDMRMQNYHYKPCPSCGKPQAPFRPYQIHDPNVHHCIDCAEKMKQLKKRGDFSTVSGRGTDISAPRYDEKGRTVLGKQQIHTIPKTERHIKHSGKPES